MSSKPIPLLCAGGGEPIGRVVIETMKPEYEIIHFTLAAVADKEIPLLLKGEVPDPCSSSLGTGNWTEPPAALLLGGAFQDEHIERLQRLVEEGGAKRKIPWLRIDASKPTPAAPPNPAYGVAIVQRMKDELTKLKEEGKLDGGDGGVYFA